MTAMFKLETSTAICSNHQVNMVVIAGNVICPKCATEDLQKSKVLDANAQAEQWITNRTKQAFFPRRHTDCTLKSYVVKSQGQQFALEACVTFSKDFELDLNKNLMLVGSTGTGKTHLVCGITYQQCPMRCHVVYLSSF